MNPILDSARALTETLAAALWLVAAHTGALPAQATGWSYHYHPWPDAAGRSMRQVAAVRGMALDPGAAGYVALRSCRYVDTAADPTLRRRPWFVLARVGPALGWWQVVDCSAPRDYRLQDRLRDVIETDWWSARAGGWATYGGAAGPGRARATLYTLRRKEVR